MTNNCFDGNHHWLGCSDWETTRFKWIVYYEVYSEWIWDQYQQTTWCKRSNASRRGKAGTSSEPLSWQVHLQLIAVRVCSVTQTSHCASNWWSKQSHSRCCKLEDEAIGCNSVPCIYRYVCVSGECLLIFGSITRYFWATTIEIDNYKSKQKSLYLCVVNKRWRLWQKWLHIVVKMSSSSSSSSGVKKANDEIPSPLIDLVDYNNIKAWVALRASNSGVPCEVSDIQGT